MKMQRVSRRSVAVGGILAATLAVLAVEQARTFNSQPDPPGRFRFGMVGLAAGQTALPLRFEANQGQVDRSVKFLSRGEGYSAFFTPSEMVLALKPGLQRGDLPAPAPAAVLRMSLVGSNPSPAMTGMAALAGKVNYFIGNDPAQWRTNVPTYRRVKYEDVYPGVDLVYYGVGRQLEYDLVVAPGADPGIIRLSFQGTDRLALDERGGLVLHVPGGEVIQGRPRVYQEINGSRRDVSGRYVLASRQEVGFQIGAYDASRPLIIDPLLDYATYLGGTGTDEGRAVAVDAFGSAYVTGKTLSAIFPPVTPTTLFGAGGGGTVHAYVAKLNPGGSDLEYLTYFGGSGQDEGNAIAVDTEGRAYVTGVASSGFPFTPDAFDSQPAGSSEAFILKLDNTGSALLFSTYLGGGTADEGWGIAVDPSYNAFVTGLTTSPAGSDPLLDFLVTPGAYQTTRAGGSDAFVLKIDLSETGAALLKYSTLLGGNQDELGIGVGFDTDGNAYVGGETTSLDFPVPNGFDTMLGSAGSGRDLFAAKLSPNGASVLYGTYVGGGNGVENGTIQDGGLAVDDFGHMYVTGATTSTDLPTTASAFQPQLGGTGDAFVFKIDPLLVGSNSLVYGTYLGGTASDRGTAIAADSSGNAYVTGYTVSGTFPITGGCTFQAVKENGSDAFLARLNADGSDLIYSTFLGGDGADIGKGVAVDAGGNAYVTGETSSLNFPATALAFQTVFQGGSGNDGFVAKVPTALCIADLVLRKKGEPNPVLAGDTLTYTVEVFNPIPPVGDGVTATGVEIQDTLPGSVTFVSASASQGPGCTESGNVVTCPLGDVAVGSSARVLIEVIPTVQGTITNVATVTSLTGDPNSANNTSAATTIVTGGESDLVLTKTASPEPVLLGSKLTYTIQVANKNGVQTAADVKVIDNLTAGQIYDPVLSSPQCSLTGGTVTCNLGSILSGQSKAVSIVVTPVAKGTITNGAIATSTTVDLDFSDNTDLVTTTVVEAADLAVTKTAFPATGLEGNTLEYTLTVTNNGPLAATGVILTDDLPDSVLFGGNSGPCSGIDPVVCDLGTLPSGATASIKIFVVPTGPGTITNTATVTSGVADPIPANNTVTISTNVAALLPLQQQIDWIKLHVDGLATEGELTRGQGRALTALLDAASRSLDRRNPHVAEVQLESFVGLVSSYVRVGFLSPRQGQPLIDAANAIIELLRPPGPRPRPGSGRRGWKPMSSTTTAASPSALGTMNSRAKPTPVAVR